MNLMDKLNLNFVNYILNNIEHEERYHEDLYQTGVVGLMYAKKLYGKEIEILSDFQKFAEPYITNEIIKEINNENKYNEYLIIR